MKKFVFLTTALCLLVCTCTRMGVSARSTTKQTLLGGVYYANWAWGYIHVARYIDNKGNIYQVSYVWTDSIWTVGADGTYSEGEIQRLLKKATKISRKIPQDTLKMIRKLIKPAGEGTYSERVQASADAGGTVSFAFLYEPVSKSYKQFELKVEGDLTYENTSQSAQKLHQLFKSILGWNSL